MCVTRSFKPKSLNDDSVKKYVILKSQGKGLDSLPKSGNQVRNIKANAKTIRSGLRIPTKNLHVMAGNQLPV